MSVLEYICRYICHKTFTKLRFQSKYSLQAIDILKSNKYVGVGNSRLINAKDRGGLWTMNQEFNNLLLHVEM